MIADKDRSEWFGASDTHFIMGNWETKTFQNWWLEKMGLRHNDFTNQSMMAGTYWEHRILESLGKNIEYDKQILIPELKLRVNLDGNDNEYDYEVKTYNLEKGFKLSKAYIQQVNVQMYASGLKGVILAYGLKASDYTNYFAPITCKSLASHYIAYDKSMIDEWLKKIKYLAECLKNKHIPTAEEFRRL